MSRPCQICQDPRAAEMEEEIAGGKSIRSTAERFNVSNDSLYRHVNFHTGMGTDVTATANADTSEFNTLAEIDKLLRDTRTTLDASRNPVQRRDLIKYQITLLDMRQELVEKRAASQREPEEDQFDFDKLTKEEEKVFGRLVGKMLGHAWSRSEDVCVIRDGRVTPTFSSVDFPNHE